MDFKNGLTGADSIFFSTVITHQSFFFNSLTNEKEVSNEKSVAMHSSRMQIAGFTSRGLQIGTISFIMLAEVIPVTFSCCLQCHRNM